MAVGMEIERQFWQVFANKAKRNWHTTNLSNVEKSDLKEPLAKKTQAAFNSLIVSRNIILLLQNYFTNK